MKHYGAIGLLLLLCVGVYQAQEVFNLTTPKPAVTQYRLSQVRLVWGVSNSCAIYITMTANVPSESFTHQYEGATACTMLQQLNRANLTTTSLQKRIMDRLIADDVLQGTVAGAPE